MAPPKAKSRPKPKSAKPALAFERKNQDILKLPSYARIHKRPIPHPPTPSPHAPASTPKVVYLATHTPFMSAAKRVQKLLVHAERRALKAAGISLAASTPPSGGGGNERRRLNQLADSSDALAHERVYVKATGRAIDKAMRLAAWFEEKAEYATTVRTGAVAVVDDIVEDEEAREEEEEKAKKLEASQTEGIVADMAVDNVGEAEAKDGPSCAAEASADATSQNQNQDLAQGQDQNQNQKPKKRKRNNKKKLALDADGELLESRTRYVNMVEVAIMLK